MQDAGVWAADLNDVSPVTLIRHSLSGSEPVAHSGAMTFLHVIIASERSDTPSLPSLHSYDAQGIETLLSNPAIPSTSTYLGLCAMALSFLLPPPLMGAKETRSDVFDWERKLDAAWSIREG